MGVQGVGNARYTCRFRPLDDNPYAAKQEGQEGPDGPAFRLRPADNERLREPNRGRILVSGVSSESGDTSDEFLYLQAPLSIFVENPLTRSRCAIKHKPGSSVADLPLESFSQGDSYQSADVGIAERIGLTQIGARYSEVPPVKPVVPVTSTMSRMRCS